MHRWLMWLHEPSDAMYHLCASGAASGACHNPFNRRDDDDMEGMCYDVYEFVQHELTQRKLTENVNNIHEQNSTNVTFTCVLIFCLYKASGGSCVWDICFFFF